MPEPVRGGPLAGRPPGPGPTAAYAGIKEAARYSAGHDLAGSLEKEAEVQTVLGGTKDHQAATLAFTRRQRPTFQGR